MPYFKDTQNKLHCLDDSTFIHLLPQDVIEITLDEANELRKPSPADIKAAKQGEIDALEASQYMTRGEREGWLAMIEAQAAAQSVPLDVLYAANPFYKKLKDVNTAVTALRAELKAIV